MTGRDKLRIVEVDPSDSFHPIPRPVLIGKMAKETSTIYLVGGGVSP